ncbi:MAG: hypothetical protein ACI81R_000265 [Bradymonadia bacterium]
MLPLAYQLAESGPMLDINRLVCRFNGLNEDGVHVRYTLHRSENLHIYRDDEDPIVQVEIRFSTSSARGIADGACPRCGNLGKPAFWEMEGPDGKQNTVWLNCPQPSECEDEFTWSRTVTFEDWDDQE